MNTVLYVLPVIALSLARFTSWSTEQLKTSTRTSFGVAKSLTAAVLKIPQSRPKEDCSSVATSNHCCLPSPRMLEKAQVPHLYYQPGSRCGQPDKPPSKYVGEVTQLLEGLCSLVDLHCRTNLPSPRPRWCMYFGYRTSEW